MKGIVAAGFAALPMLALTGCAAAPSAPSGPSFSCASLFLTAAEKVICKDEELSANDRAVALAIRWGVRTLPNDVVDDRNLKLDRDRCGASRRCILSAYRSWFGLQYFPRNVPRLDRTDRSDAGSGDDWADLIVLPLGGGWHLFHATATHAYDPHDGRGANISDSMATGAVRLAGGKGWWPDDPNDPGGCRLSFTKRGDGTWRLFEPGARCSGIGSTLTGTYASQIRVISNATRSQLIGGFRNSEG